jgi:hypothetical protein
MAIPHARSGLSEQEQAYVEAFIRCGSKSHAAKAAGSKNSTVDGIRLFRRPMVQKAIEDAQARILKQLDYNSVEAVKDLDRKIELATIDQQHSAAAKYTELKLKTLGLLIDKIDLRASTPFNLTIRGFGHEDPAPAIDVTPVATAIEGAIAQIVHKSDDEDMIDDGSDLID